MTTPAPCDGTTTEEAEFELKASERGRASIMETIDFTVDESLANSGYGHLLVDLRRLAMILNDLIDFEDVHDASADGRDE